MAITHASTYARPGNLDFPDPAQWNANHIFPPLNVCINTGNVTWTNQPLALTELFGTVHRRQKIDLTNATQIRLSVRVSTVGVAAAVVYAQYSTDESAWSTLTTNQISLATTTATKVTAWENVPVGALADVFIRVVGSGGDGAADPILGNIHLQVR